MKNLNKPGFRVCQSLLMALIIAALATIDYWGCTEYITNINTIFVRVNTLAGTVIEGDYNSFISDSTNASIGSTVTLSGPVNKATNTDSLGRYQFDSIPIGNYKVVVTKNGYTNGFRNVAERDFETGIPNIYITQLSPSISIGQNGGVIQGQGYIITIPPGALNTQENIRVTRIIVTDFEKFVISGFKMEPTGLQFNIPIKLSTIAPELNLNDTSSLEAYTLNEQIFEWKKENKKYEIRNDTISLFIDHFSAVIKTSKITFIEWEATGEWSNPSGNTPDNSTEYYLHGKTQKNQTIILKGPTFLRSNGYSCSIKKIEESENTFSRLTAPSITVPQCTIAEIKGRFYFKVQHKNIKYRYCNISNNGNICGNWSTTRLARRVWEHEYKVNQLIGHRDGDCHDQGGGEKQMR